MTITSKKVYVEVELDWAEDQLHSWKEYINAHPMHELVDRIEWKPTAKGGVMPMVIASIEAQGKFLQETMKNYLMLLKEVDAMREKEAAKQVEAKGAYSIPYRMLKAKEDGV